MKSPLNYRGFLFKELNLQKRGLNFTVGYKIQWLKEVERGKRRMSLWSLLYCAGKKIVITRLHVCFFCLCCVIRDARVTLWGVQKTFIIFI